MSKPLRCTCQKSDLIGIVNGMQVILRRDGRNFVENVEEALGHWVQKSQFSVAEFIEKQEEAMALEREREAAKKKAAEYNRYEDHKSKIDDDYGFRLLNVGSRVEFGY